MRNPNPTATRVAVLPLTPERERALEEFLNHDNDNDNDQEEEPEANEDEDEGGEAPESGS